MSARRSAAAADRIVLTRGLLTGIVKVARLIEADAVDTALLYAGSELNAVSGRLAIMDTNLDKLATLIERARIAVGDEWTAQQPTQSEDVAA